MKSKKILLLVCAAALAAHAARAQFTHTYSTNTSLPLPSSGTGGAPGGTANPANATTLTVDVPIAVQLSHLAIETYISHPTVGDLRIEIEHCGASVLLYNQSPASTANLSGTYRFDDSAMTTFAAAINAAGSNGTVSSGTYLPATTLGVFDGWSSAGAWTIKVYDLAANAAGGLFSLSVTVIGVDTYQSGAIVTPIPDGLNGQCLSPVVRVITVPTHAVISDAVVRVNLQHSYVSDLDITIEHAGVSVALSRWASPTSSADVQGIYGFWDGAPTPWTAAESLYSGTGVIPALTYRPLQPLAAFSGLDQFGPWYLTVCDRSAVDVGTLGGVFLEFSHSPYELTLSQPGGPASITLVNGGGVPGHGFVNLFTLAQGGAPYGWVAGLDISLAEVVNQVSIGSPFTGTLGPCGLTVVPVAGPIPSGLTLWCASFELDASMTPVATKRVFTYTTQ